MEPLYQSLRLQARRTVNLFQRGNASIYDVVDVFEPEYPTSTDIYDQAWQSLTLPQREEVDELIRRRRRYRALVAFLCCLLCLLGVLITIGVLVDGDDDDDDSTTTTSSTPSPTIPNNCCPQDLYTYAGSPFGSSSPNSCGNFDYNCDGIETSYPCCHDNQPFTYDTILNRTIWNVTSSCSEFGALPSDPSVVCGACNDGRVYAGWSCTDTWTKKRFVPPCPSQCSDNIIDITRNMTPDVGECGLFVTGCYDDVTSTDTESCCVVVKV